MDRKGTYMALSKTDKRCTNCKHFNNCDKKRMVACAEIPFTKQMSQPLIKESIDIHISSDIVASVNNDKILKQIADGLHKQLQCSFNN